MIEIHNVVGCGTLGKDIQLKPVAEDLNKKGKDATYDPENHGGLLLKLDDRAPMMTVHSSGSYLLGGAESHEDLFAAHETLIDEFAELGVIDRPYESDFEIRNIVSTGDLEENMNLETLAIGLGLADIEYNPEEFAGLVYRINVEDESLVTIVFESGKVVIVGARTISSVEAAFDTLRHEIADALPYYEIQEDEPVEVAQTETPKA